MGTDRSMQPEVCPDCARQVTLMPIGNSGKSIGHGVVCKRCNLIWAVDVSPADAVMRYNRLPEHAEG